MYLTDILRRLSVDETRPICWVSSDLCVRTVCATTHLRPLTQSPQAIQQKSSPNLKAFEQF